MPNVRKLQAQEEIELKPETCVPMRIVGLYTITVDHYYQVYFDYGSKSPSVI